VPSGFPVLLLLTGIFFLLLLVLYPLLQVFHAFTFLCLLMEPGLRSACGLLCLMYASLLLEYVSGICTLCSCTIGGWRWEVGGPSYHCRRYSVLGYTTGRLEYTTFCWATLDTFYTFTFTHVVSTYLHSVPGLGQSPLPSAIPGRLYAFFLCSAGLCMLYYIYLFHFAVIHDVYAIPSLWFTIYTVSVLYTS
jgi:hypothetical protein